MNKEEIRKFIENLTDRNVSDFAVDYLFMKFKEAYNTINVPEVYKDERATITVNDTDEASVDNLFQFLVANLRSTYFNAFAKRIIDYKENKRVIPAHVIENFKLFYELYPKKINRHNAWLKYSTLNPSQMLHNKIMEGLLKQATIWRRDGQDKKYIPAPAVWLNGKRWENEDLQSISLTQVASTMDRVL